MLRIASWIWRRNCFCFRSAAPKKLFLFFQCCNYCYFRERQLGSCRATVVTLEFRQALFLFVCYRGNWFQEKEDFQVQHTNTWSQRRAIVQSFRWVNQAGRDWVFNEKKRWLCTPRAESIPVRSASPLVTEGPDGQPCERFVLTAHPFEVQPPTLPFLMLFFSCWPRRLAVKRLVDVMPASAFYFVAFAGEVHAPVPPFLPRGSCAQLLWGSVWSFWSCGRRLESVRDAFFQQHKGLLTWDRSLISHFDDLDISGAGIFLICIRMRDLARAAVWEPCNLRDLGHSFLGWLCTMQILHSISIRKVTISMI